MHAEPTAAGSLGLLAASTKMGILRSLATGPKMPSALSKSLDKSGPTITEHLDDLVEAGLVIKMRRQGRKFVFYELSDKGRSITGAVQRIRGFFYSALALFVIGGATLTLGAVLSNQAVPFVASSTQGVYNTAAVAPQASVSLLVIAGIVLLIIALALLLAYLMRKARLELKVNLYGWAWNER